MWIGPLQEVIDSNVFMIPQRLKEVDPGYFVVRNHKKKTWEIHHLENGFGTYSLTLPYPELDARAIDWVQKTSRQNSERLIREMERNNELIEVRKKKELDDYVEETAKDIYKYGQHHSEDVRLI